ncbi:MAG TPA: c-type cytochrome biogenesis protein CcsB [Thermomicrobiales bacterium]|nr:c-type cytochrome biogenesis protein CcsB [Thermomicrobiales bacterium]
MDGLVRFSFYCFAASSMSLWVAAAAYIVYAVGRVRVSQRTMMTSAGTSVTSTGAEFGPGEIGFGRIGTMMAFFGAFFAGISILLRAIAANHVVLSNMYEYSLVFVFFCSTSYLIIERVYGVRQLGAIVITIAALMTAYIWYLPAEMREINPVVPALQAGMIMPFHVGSANLAYSVLTVSFGAAVFFLIANRWAVRWLPSAEMLDDIAFRAVTVGFPFLSLMLILGSVWAHSAWGSYWSWDPKETSALFSWLVYAIYLHTRTLCGWRGQRSAYILIFGFAALIFTYYGNYFFGGLHAYGGVQG